MTGVVEYLHAKELLENHHHLADRDRHGAVAGDRPRLGRVRVVKVLRRHPDREVELDGTMTVKVLLETLDVVPETVLVIRGGELLTRDDRLGQDDLIELRPVISGG